MVSIPDQLRCLFSARLTSRNGSYFIEVPAEELEEGSVVGGETYRVALLAGSDRGGEASADTSTGGSSRRSASEAERTPPVSEGEMREVEIEATGDQGDGIAKIDRGFVVIVPEAELGDEIVVEIEHVRSNVAFAAIRGGTDPDGEPSEQRGDVLRGLEAQSDPLESDTE